MDRAAGTAGKGRRALGRGLDALLSTADQSSLREVDIERIEPNPNQPRQRFEPEALADLAASIRAHGVVQPVVVAVAGDDRYRLIVGERRWQAAKLAGLQRLPVIVKDTSDQLTLELALVENLQRADLDPMEQAAAYQRLTRDFGLTQQEVARRVGKSRVAIANTLRLLTLPETVQQSLVERRITEGHARALLALPAARQQEAALQRVERDGLSVRATEELVRRLLESPPRREQLPLRTPDIEAMEDELRRVLGTKVTLRPTKRGGRIVIEYYSEEEFQGLYERLLASSR
jgi:ParB family transcriptional regulator, chromosome partitioning protein